MKPPARRRLAHAATLLVLVLPAACGEDARDRVQGGAAAGAATGAGIGLLGGPVGVLARPLAMRIISVGRPL